MKSVIGLLLLVALHARAASWYVSPSGSGDGSIGNPWSLSTAIQTNHTAAPGDTIYMRAGTYSGAFTSYLTGNSGARIVLRSYPGERAIIENQSTSNHHLTIRGNYADYYEIEFTDLLTDRDQDLRPTGIDVRGDHNRIRRCIIHDCGQGIADQNEGTNTEIDSNIIYYNGRFSVAVPSGTGHGLYIQNDGVGTKYVRDNIFYAQFGFGIHAYTTAGPLKGITFDNNMSFENGPFDPAGPGSRHPNLYVAGNTIAERIIATNNIAYFAVTGNQNSVFGKDMIDGTKGNKDVDIQNNYLIGGGDHTISYWTNATVRGNIWYSSGGQLTHSPGSWAHTYDWDANTYHLGGRFLLDGVSRDFTAWKSLTSYDASSTYSASAPGSNVSLVRRDRVDTNRSYVTVFNWQSLSTVSVDCSSVLQVGQSYAIRDAQNYFGSLVASGIITSTTLAFPMTGLTPATPIGHSAPTTTSPKFAIFIIDVSSQVADSATAVNATVTHMSGQ